LKLQVFQVHGVSFGKMGFQLSGRHFMPKVKGFRPNLLACSPG
jgi:hypothetical protein